MAVGLALACQAMQIAVSQLPILGLFWVAGLIVLPWLYYALLESSSKQATIGKALLGLRVVSAQGLPLSFGRATGRYFGKFLSHLLFGHLLVLMTKRKQALHDKLAGTVVTFAAASTSSQAAH
jgi:uncharacterized RDD family membrane protein YckC